MNLRPDFYMNCCARALIISALLILALALPMTSSAAPDADKMWVLQQASEIWGPVTTYFCKRGARLDFMHVSYLITPDIHSSVLMSAARKTVADFDATQMSHGSKKVVKFPDIKPGASAKFLGYACQEYTLKDKDETQEAWMTREILVPQQFVQALTDVIHFPSNFGVPLRFFRQARLGKKVTVFDTISVKHVAYDPKLFRIPTGYKKIQDPYDMLLYEESSGIDKDSSELLQSAGVKSRLMEHSKGTLDSDAEDLLNSEMHGHREPPKKN